MAYPRRALGVAASVAALGLTLYASPAVAKTHTVSPGESIQAAINAADPGDKVLVEKGTYRESLLIDKDGIVLKGDKAKLAKPSSPGSNPCNEEGPVVGVCVIGKGNFDTGEVTDPVSRVRIKGFTIKGFTGEGIFAFFADRFRVNHDKLVRNDGYGVFSLHSTRVRYTHNVARRNGEAGFYIGDSPGAQALVDHNRSIGNSAEGILLRSLTFVEASHNSVRGNCAGILALADAPGPAKNIDIADNRVRKNNQACTPAPGDEEPPESGLGIAVVGAARTVVRRNVVTGHEASGPSFASGGIVVQKGLGGTEPSHIAVRRNVANDNKPHDIDWDGTGTVEFSKNECGSGQPAEVCP
jgi:parallel beta helix pectate lyase-like protein